MTFNANRYVDEALRGKQKPEPATRLQFIVMDDWDNGPAPERPWGVREPTLFSGEGAVGKSLVELQLCAAHVLGRDWMNALVEPGPAIYLGAEDDSDELRRRLTPIVTHYQTTFHELINGGLHLLSLAGQDALLAVPDRSGKIIATPLFQSILDAARDIRPTHIGIDTSADVYGGNENDRAQVRQFIGLLRHLAITADSSVVLLSHPSNTGINNGTGISGSTGWHNSVRARMYLTSVKPEDGEQPENDLRVLHFKKNNYGPVSESIVLRYRNGLFLPEGGASNLEKAAKEAKADQCFLDLLKRYNANGRNVSDHASATNYAPNAFVREKQVRAAALRKHDIDDAMRRLFDANQIRVETYGRPSRPYRRIVEC